VKVGSGATTGGGCARWESESEAIAGLATCRTEDGVAVEGRRMRVRGAEPRKCESLRVFGCGSGSRVGVIKLFFC
jgi:hypothetical protein